MAWPLSCLQRLLCGNFPILFTAPAAWFLCGLALILFTELAVWLGPYAVYAVYGACCEVFALTLCTVLAVWFCFCLMYGGCRVAFVPILFTWLAVWLGPQPVCRACCVVLLQTYVQRLLCGIAPIL